MVTTPYKTIQKSWVHFVLIPLMIILILFTGHFPPWLLGFLGGFTVILFLFHSLIVEVNNKVLKVKFGPGLIKKQFKIDDIIDCKPVKFHFPHTFGVHFKADSNVYNVSGSDGIELTLKNKRKTIKIGTDHPKELCETIRNLLNQE